MTATAARTAISLADRAILRPLVEEKARIAALPVQKEKIALWTKLNDLKTGVRPLVWINEICWHEMNVNDEMTLRCTGGFARGVEWGLRAEIYQWKHLPADMIVDPWICCPLAIGNTGYGVGIKETLISQHESGGIHSHGYINQFETIEDAQKIKDPVVTHDIEETEARFTALQDAVGDILPIRKTGVGMQWFAPWDLLVMWYNPQQALMDMALNPELIHALMERLSSAMWKQMEQYKALNLLSTCHGNCRIGSGGLGYTEQLPAKGFKADHVRPIDQWGCGVAQIMSEVSPEMHEEFALRYERPWMEQFGLTYYGCCEQLDRKIGMLKSVKNLRKISMSPWANHRRGAELLGRDYVFSLKPNPAIFATDTYNPAQAEKELRASLEAAKGCNIEIIAKDLSTMRDQPQRLWQWAEMAVRVAGEYWN